MNASDCFLCLYFPCSVHNNNKNSSSSNSKGGKRTKPLSKKRTKNYQAITVISVSYCSGSEEHE